MKHLFIGLIWIGLTIWLGLMMYNGIIADYVYKKEIYSWWDLAEKASTIPKKIEYLDRFVVALEKSNLQGKHNAVWLKKPSNSFDYNFQALKSLQDRLHQIQNMDITSFQYQTAIQQITAQEQGEAENMLKEFGGIWWKTYYPLLWEWYCLLFVLFWMICVSGMIILTSRIYGN